MSIAMALKRAAEQAGAVDLLEGSRAQKALETLETNQSERVYFNA